MSFKVIVTNRFEKEIKRLAKKYPSLKQEFAQLVEDVSENPELGVFLGNNCYKIRLAIKSKGKGKSGGARVITYLYIDAETLYLLSIYDKSETSTITQQELEEMVEGLDLTS